MVQEPAGTARESTQSEHPRPFTELCDELLPAFPDPERGTDGFVHFITEYEGAMASRPGGWIRRWRSAAIEQHFQRSLCLPRRPRQEHLRWTGRSSPIFGGAVLVVADRSA